MTVYLFQYYVFLQFFVCVGARLNCDTNRNLSKTVFDAMPSVMTILCHISLSDVIELSFSSSVGFENACTLLHRKRVIFVGILLVGMITEKYITRQAFVI